MSGRGDDRISMYAPDGLDGIPRENPHISGHDAFTKSEQTTIMNRPDMVQHPAHYKQYPVEVIDIIRHVLGQEGFRAYCIGNELKYRLRAGDKGDAAQDLAKAMKYREFREAK